MRKFSIGLAVTAAVLSIAMLMSMMPTTAATATTGNGAPSGAHYNLNIIGVQKAKTGVDATNDGHRIFVNLYGAGTKIWLKAGDSFQVLDADGTDGSATFQMLDPYPNNTTTSVYKIYAQ